MTRKDLIYFLEGNPRTVRQLAVEMRQSPADVEEDLVHITKSLRNQPFCLKVVPAECRKCGFVFSNDRFRKPSKCPECRGTWLTEPEISTSQQG
jgi:transcriptional regulator